MSLDVSQLTDSVQIPNLPGVLRDIFAQADVLYATKIAPAFTSSLALGTLSDTAGAILTVQSDSGPITLRSQASADAGTHAGIGRGGKLIAGSGMAFPMVISHTAAQDIVFGTTDLERVRLTSGGILLVGTTVVTGAAAGALVLGNNARIRGVNVAGTNTIEALRITSADQVALGALSVILLGNPATATSANAGDAVLGSTKFIRGANNAGSDTINLIGADASDRVAIGTGGNNIRLGSGGVVMINTTVTSGASGGELILANSKAVLSVNNAGTGMIALVNGNASDQLVLQNGGGDIKWGRANIALGGGGAPTFGTVGGSGPAATAQRNWLRFIESDGTASFIPVWR